MKMQSIILTSLLAMFMASCSTNRVISDYEKGIDFSQYITFNLVEHDHGFPIGANPINKQRIERAIENEMTSRGYKKAENPDLKVAWFVKVETHRSIDTYGEYYGRWRRMGMMDVNVYEYKVGTLVIDLIDAEKNHVVWHGATFGMVEEDMKNVEEKINGAVHAMFERYHNETGQGAIVPSLVTKN